MASTKELMSTVLDLRGIDMVTPVDLLKDGHTPYSKNFRLYAQQADDRKVAVSSSKGPGYYTTPLGQVLYQSNTATDGAGVAKVGVIAGVHSFTFTATDSSRLTEIQLQVADTEGADGPLLVKVYSDAGGTPGRLLTESSILSGSIGNTPAWLSAKFINSVQLSSGSQYWVVLSIQDDGKHNYDVITTTSGTPAWKTDSALSQLTQQTYAINYRVYTAPDQPCKGAYRFTRDNGNNTTVAVYGTTIYRVDDTTGTLIPIIGGLSSSATEYNFDNGDNKVFWVNGFDQLTNWDGTIESQASNIVSNPSFNTSTASYAALSGSTITRVTTDFHSTPASLQVTASTGIRGTALSQLLYANRRYKISYWAKGVAGTGNTFVTVNGGTTALAGSTVALPSGWKQFSFYYVPGSDVNTIEFKNTTDNFFLDDVSVIDTGIEYIIDDQLPILSDMRFHKDRIWGQVAADKNKIVFSENPGNPAFDPTGAIATTSRQQWYYAWLSVSFLYVPRPHNGSPITSMTSFQDSLTVTTQDNKYVISGYDRGTINQRQATGSKGAISRRGVVADENQIWLVSDDGFYVHNGSSDTKISDPISPLFDACPRKSEITPVLWKNQVRFYMASEGSPVNDICAIYDKTLKEWMLDTDMYIDRALYYNDADDQGQLAEISSLTSTMYFAERSYNKLGAPIDFEYRLKYDSMKTPMQRKRLKRFYPILAGVDSTFTIQLAMDKDFEDSPKIKEQLLSTNGAKIGEFKLGDGTLLGGDKSFKPKRQSYSGYAYYWQLRVKRKGVNNRVAFIGAEFSYKTKRL